MCFGEVLNVAFLELQSETISYVQTKVFEMSFSLRIRVGAAVGFALVDISRRWAFYSSTANLRVMTILLTWASHGRRTII
jgi:hypothetical protein